MKLKTIAGLVISLFLSSEVLAAASTPPKSNIKSPSSSAQVPDGVTPPETTSLKDNDRGDETPIGSNSSRKKVGFVVPNSSLATIEQEEADIVTWGKKSPSPEVVAALQTLAKDGAFQSINGGNAAQVAAMKKLIEGGKFTQSAAISALFEIQNGRGTAAVNFLSPKEGAALYNILTEFNEKQQPWAAEILAKQIDLIEPLIGDRVFKLPSGEDFSTPTNTVEFRVAYYALMTDGLIKRGDSIYEAIKTLGKPIDNDGWAGPDKDLLVFTVFKLDAELQNPDISVADKTRIESTLTAMRDYTLITDSDQNYVLDIPNKGQRPVAQENEVRNQLISKMSDNQKALYDAWEDFRASLASIRVLAKITGANTAQDNNNIALIESAAAVYNEYKQAVADAVNGTSSQARKGGSSFEAALAAIENVTRIVNVNLDKNVTNISQLNDLDVASLKLLTPTRIQSLLAVSSDTEIDNLLDSTLAKLSGAQLFAGLDKLTTAQVATFSDTQKTEINVVLSKLTPVEIEALSNETLAKLTGSQLVTIVTSLNQDQKASISVDQINAMVASSYQERAYANLVNLSPADKTEFETAYKNILTVRYDAIVKGTLNWSTLNDINTALTGLEASYPGVDISVGRAAVNSLSKTATSSLQTALETMSPATVLTSLATLAEQPEAMRTSSMAVAALTYVVDKINLSAFENISPKVIQLFSGDDIANILSRATSTELTSYGKNFVGNLSVEQLSSIGDSLPLAAKSFVTDAQISAMADEAYTQFAANNPGASNEVFKDAYTAAKQIQYEVSIKGTINWQNLTSLETQITAYNNEKNNPASLNTGFLDVVDQIQIAIEAMSPQDLAQNLESLVTSPTELSTAIMGDSLVSDMLTSLATSGVNIGTLPESVQALYTPEIVQGIVAKLPSDSLADFSSILLAKLPAEELAKLYNKLTPIQKAGLLSRVSDIATVEYNKQFEGENFGSMSASEKRIFQLTGVAFEELVLNADMSGAIDWVKQSSGLANLEGLQKKYLNGVDKAAYQEVLTLKAYIRSSTAALQDQITKMSEAELLTNLENLGEAVSATSQSAITSMNDNPLAKSLVNQVAETISLTDFSNLQPAAIGLLSGEQVLDILQRAPTAERKGIPNDFVEKLTGAQLLAVVDQLTPDEKASITNEQISGMAEATYSAYNSAHADLFNELPAGAGDAFEKYYTAALEVSFAADFSGTVDWSNLLSLQQDKVSFDTAMLNGGSHGDLAILSASINNADAVITSMSASDILKNLESLVSDSDPDLEDAVTNGKSALLLDMLVTLAFYSENFPDIQPEVLDLYTTDVVNDLLSTATAPQIKRLSPEILSHFNGEQLYSVLPDLNPGQIDSLIPEIAEIAGYVFTEQTAKMNLTVDEADVVRDAIEMRFNLRIAGTMDWSSLASIIETSETFSAGNGLDTLNLNLAKIQQEAVTLFENLYPSQLENRLAELARLPDNELNKLLAPTADGDESLVSLILTGVADTLTLSDVMGSDSKLAPGMDSEVIRLFSPSDILGIIDRAPAEEVAKLSSPLLNKFTGQQLLAIADKLTPEQMSTVTAAQLFDVVYAAGDSGITTPIIDPEFGGVQEAGSTGSDVSVKTLLKYVTGTTLSNYLSDKNYNGASSTFITDYLADFSAEQLVDVVDDLSVKQKALITPAQISSLAEISTKNYLAAHELTGLNKSQKAEFTNLYQIKEEITLQHEFSAPGTPVDWENLYKLVAGLQKLPQENSVVTELSQSVSDVVQSALGDAASGTDFAQGVQAIDQLKVLNLAIEQSVPAGDETGSTNDKIALGFEQLVTSLVKSGVTSDPKLLQDVINLGEKMQKVINGTDPRSLLRRFGSSVMAAITGDTALGNYKVQLIADAAKLETQINAIPSGSTSVTTATNDPAVAAAQAGIAQVEKLTVGSTTGDSEVISSLGELVKTMQTALEMISKELNNKVNFKADGPLSNLDKNLTKLVDGWASINTYLNEKSPTTAETTAFDADINQVFEAANASEASLTDLSKAGSQQSGTLSIAAVDAAAAAKGAITDVTDAVSAQNTVSTEVASIDSAHYTSTADKLLAEFAAQAYSDLLNKAASEVGSQVDPYRAALAADLKNLNITVNTKDNPDLTTELVNALNAAAKVNPAYAHIADELTKDFTITTENGETVYTAPTDYIPPPNITIVEPSSDPIIPLPEDE